MAAGTVPIFHGLGDESQPPFAVPFIPRDLLLSAQEGLLPYTGEREAAYNETVRKLLSHTRRCLTAESMAARVLRTLGVWPTRRPLKLLYVTCGFGFLMGRGLDGWQGPVSIGLYLGLQSLLRGSNGSMIVDAPDMELDTTSWVGNAPGSRLSYFWALFERDPSSNYAEVGLRRELMYGFGFSYARRLPRGREASRAERARVEEAIRQHEFDAIIYGKVGPAQGCDPPPFLDYAIEHGYPRSKVAFIYGGDFGLSSKHIVRHAYTLSPHGMLFFREIDPDPSRLSWRPEEEAWAWIPPQEEEDNEGP